MQGRAPPVYRRGKYWLEKLRRDDGTERSPRWYIFWYDPAARREASASTGTADVDQAILALDRRYLSDAGEAPAYCHTCGQPLASAEAYLLSDAIADYRLEHGDLKDSAVSIQARLKHVVDFMSDEEGRGGTFGISTSCAVACGMPFVTAFRAWSKARPVVWRNKAGVVTASRPRSAATTEESVLQVAAALNHAADADPPRSERRPIYRPLPRKQVSRPRRVRVDVPVIADMLAYAAELNKKRASLHAFMVASLCTIARPDSVVDICVSPDREQWYPGSPTLDLNPFGRAQTNKYRPLIPVMPVLAEWLAAELVAFRRLDQDQRKGAGYLVNYYGRAVQDVDRAWSTMLTGLKLPTGREWKPYLLRHSLATILRNRGVAKWDLEGFMGHAVTGSTEVYAIGRFATVTAALTDMLGEIDLRAPGALRRTGAEVALPGTPPMEVKMTG
ncbi:tyrosine-type recombinase/integrase [Sphingomonas solaris]|uniref:Tyrosine-type recombinase/integrase n=1 Tax=Alterirhizorhabdus solaris TaxID=2529389 RepID=A0A558R7E6_9SPHN|nr:tyrosine-type recombinase/integrase [Sphingomonas solaris]TVV75311.1 tyrosine-type recombinase/integrase [Sphingomonas solaris]